MVAFVNLDLAPVHIAETTYACNMSPKSAPSQAGPSRAGASQAGPPTPPMGNIDEYPKQKRARTSKPKVKTGCYNCKQRRIKCDEQRPSCSNCIRSKKLCTGYPAPSRSARPSEQLRLAPRPIANGAPPARETAQTPSVRQLQKFQKRVAERANLAVISPPQSPAVMFVHPCTTLPFNEQEGLYFRLFREQTASELSGFFDNLFWSQGVLQECHTDAAIRHAVVALGALYKTLEMTCESPPTSPNNSQDADPIDTPIRHWEMAVKKYSHALDELLNPQTNMTHRTRLMASILLSCFDSFIGDHKQAIKQIQTGLSLLEQLRAERRRAFLPKPEEPVEAELIQMFTRLAIQAKSYDMAFHFPHPYVIHLTGQSNADPNSPPAEETSPVSLHHDPIPERFSTSIEARLAWDALVERIFRFTETMFAHVSSGPMGVLPAELRQYGAGFKLQIEAWSDAYDHIFESRTAPGISSQEKAAIAALKMTQVMSRILFLMTFSASEMQFDLFNQEFKKIVDLALEVVGDEERRAAARRCPDPRFCQHHTDHGVDIFGGHEYEARHIKPSFSADLGIVPPLFFVATKCRDPHIRRQAIQLLRSSARREGMWDSELAARIGIWVAGIEEDDLQAITSAASVEVHATSAIHASRPSTSGSSSGRATSVDFADSNSSASMGTNGSAHYDDRRSGFLGSQQKKVVPAERRVMIKAVEFDLRERVATIQLGTRELATGAPDLKTRVTQIMW